MTPALDLDQPARLDRPQRDACRTAATRRACASSRRASTSIPPPFADGAELPPLWHWIFTTPLSPLREAGPDGHPARGGFLPPVPLPRRMWAGSQLEWLRAPRLGEPLERESKVESVDMKEGRSGTLVFVKVLHQWSSGDALLMREGQDIVYRDAPPAARATPNPPAEPPVWREPLDAGRARCPLVPNEVLLFRYSALTFNSHRIHYDRRYCLEVEGYPGLVVHGPLLATVMATLAWLQAGRRAPRGFSFRAQAPVFDGEAITVHAAARRVLDPGPKCARPTAPSRRPAR